MTRGRITVIVVAVALASIVAVIASSVDFGNGDDADSSERSPATTEPATALIRPANFRRALAVLERERRKVDGVFDGLRLAPSRIDTTIIHPADRMTSVQIRPDLEISSKFTHDFPTQPDFRRGGLSAGDVDVAAPARLLREFDRQRHGSATEDVDYCVIDRDIIDFRVNISCYMRVRTARPRSFLKEAGEPLRVIG